MYSITHECLGWGTRGSSSIMSIGGGVAVHILYNNVLSLLGHSVAMMHTHTCDEYGVHVSYITLHIRHCSRCVPRVGYTMVDYGSRV